MMAEIGAAIDVNTNSCGGLRPVSVLWHKRSCGTFSQMGDVGEHDKSVLGASSSIVLKII